jgi:innexin
LSIGNNECLSKVCWVRNTYYIDENSPIPDNMDVRRQSSIRYYQWIPFILLFEAFFFFFPYILWRVLCQRSGIDIREIVEASTTYKKSADENKREQLMTFMVSIIDQYIDDPRRQSNNRVVVWWKKCFLMCFSSSSRYTGDYLRNLFLFIKLIYLINVFIQVLLLAYLLDQPFWSLGITVLQYLYQGKGWNFHSRYFPKVTLW